MKLIFCLSFVSVPRAMTLAGEDDKEYKLITFTPELLKFFREFYHEDKIIFFERIPGFSRNPFELPKNLMRIAGYKKRLKKQFMAFEDCDIYFFGIACCEIVQWLVSELAVKNTVHYTPAVSMAHLKKRYTPYSILYIFMARLVYGVWLSPLWKGNGYYFSAGRKYKEKIKALPAGLEVRADVLRKALNKKFDFSGSKVLLMTGGAVEDQSVSEEAYIEGMDRVITLLESKFGPGAVAVKVHPRYGKRYSRENELDEIPSYIPANILFSFFSIAIGYNSASVFEAANEGLTAISLLEYFPAFNKKEQQSYEDYIKLNAKQEVYFPGDIEELSRILEIRE